MLRIFNPAQAGFFFSEMLDTVFGLPYNDKHETGIAVR